MLDQLKQEYVKIVKEQSFKLWRFFALFSLVTINWQWDVRDTDRALVKSSKRIQKENLEGKLENGNAVLLGEN